MSAESALEWSIQPFGPALRAALSARGMSFRDLESRSLVPVGNLHDHVSGKRGVPGDDLMRRIADGVGVEPAYFREWRERRLVEALHRVPELELELSRRVAEDGSRGLSRPSERAAAVRTALVTGGTGLVGRALVALLREQDVRVLATARTLEGGRALAEAGAEPLHTDARNLGAWSRETADAEVVFHLGLPRLDPPLRARAARRRASPAADAAAAVGDLAGGRPVVMLSTGLLYGDRTAPAADDDPGARPAAASAAAGAAEAALAGSDLRVVRVPWVVGPGGLARDLIVGLRIGRYRIVGSGENRWSLLCAEDAAEALLAALAAPPGVYSAAEADVTTQEEVVNLVCTVPGHRRPDRLPPRLAALSMGGAVSEALCTSVWVATGRLAGYGWSPRRRWRQAVVSLAEGSLPLPRR